MIMPVSTKAAFPEWAAITIIFVGIPFIAIFFGWVAITVAVDFIATDDFFSNQEKSWAGLGALLFSSFISIGCTYTIWSFARFCYAKKIILQLPRMRTRWDEPIPQELDRIAIEVLRHSIGTLHEGFIPYPLQKELGEIRVHLLPKAWECGELSDTITDVKIPQKFYLTFLEKIEDMDFHLGLRIFQNGKVVGQQRTFWDMFFLLGPRYIVVFPSWACVSTHADGFYVPK